MAQVILVHGAWHGPWCWDGVVRQLERRDITAEVVELPFIGFDEDVAEVRRCIDSSEPGTVVVGHSYGGLVISEAARGAVNAGHLVYLAAFMLDVGEDMAQMMSQHESKLLEAVIPEGDLLMVDRVKARALFYGDSDEMSAEAAVAKLRPMRFGTIAPSAEPPAWQSLPSTYVVCTNDNALPASLQRTLAARAGAVVHWHTDHSPFLTRPDDIAELVAGYVQA